MSSYNLSEFRDYVALAGASYSNNPQYLGGLGYSVDKVYTEGFFNASIYSNLRDPSNVVLSIRGTNDGMDWWEDIGGVATGLHDIVNYQQFVRLNDIKADIARDYPGASITVVGHSLGGFYAQFTGDIADLIVTVQAPGVGGLLGQPFSSLGNLPSDKIINVKVLDDDWSGWGRANQTVEELGIGFGRDIYIPGVSGHDVEAVLLGIDYQIAMAQMFGNPGDGVFFAPPTNLPGVMTRLQRMELVRDFNPGTTLANAVAQQIRLFEANGYSPAQSRALAEYREALKFSSPEKFAQKEFALYRSGVTQPPDERDTIWAYCFSGDTQVSMADGTSKAIRDVGVGDLVLAYSEVWGGRGALVPREVTRRFLGVTDEWLQLDSGTLVTPGHRYLTESGSYVSVERLLHEGIPAVGQDGQLRTISGKRIVLTAESRGITNVGSVVDFAQFGATAVFAAEREGWLTYNIEVAGLHTYVADGLRVHNMCIDQDTHLQVTGTYAGQSGAVYTQISGYQGESYQIRNDRAEIDSSHGYVFERMPASSPYEYSRYDPTSGVTFYYRDGEAANLGYHPTTSTGGSTGSGGSGGGGNGTTTGKPILLDLDGDGLEIVPLDSSNFFFDVGGDGKQHRTAWADVGDGVLVRDDGNDGVINQHREIIFTEWDPTAKSDFEALRNVFDTNHDGTLSSADADWALFKVLVTGPDGSTELKTLADLGITSINLVSNGQEITLADGSKIKGTTTYTKAGGGTGTVGDVSLAYDADGYIVAETRSTDGSGNMTLVHRATRADGSLASQTTTVTTAGGLSRTTSFDRDGDGVLDEAQTDVTVVNGDGSRTRTQSFFDGSATILGRREVTTTSADGKTVSIARDLDGSGNTDESEGRVWDSSGNLTLTVTHLNADGSTKDEVTTVTSASGLSKTRQFEFTGSGAINATETTATSVDGSSTRTEVKTNYAGSGTLAANRVGTVTTTATVDGTSKIVAADLDGDGTVDLTTSNVIVHNSNGSTTTTIWDTNGNASLRDRSVTDLSADGKTKLISADANGDGTYELVASEVTVINGDGSTTKTTSQRAADTTLLGSQLQSWSADQKTRSTSIDRDGDGHIDQTENVLIVAGNSVTTSTTFSANGATKLNQTISSTSSDGLSQTVTLDANGDGNTDSVVTRTTSVVSGISTVTTSNWNGNQTILIGKTVEATSANGLSITTEVYLGTAGSPYEKQTDVTVQNGDSSITRTVTAFEGTSLTQTGKVVTILSADRLTTTESVYLGTNASPEKVTTSDTANTGAVTVTASQYTPDGATLIGRTVSTVSSDGLSSTTTADADGNGVTDATSTSIKTLNSSGTTTLVETSYAGSGTSAGNRVGQVTTDVSVNGLQTTVQTDANGDGTVDRQTVSTIVLNADGSTTKTVTQSNGSGATQLGKSVTTVSDDGWTTTADTFLGTRTAYDDRVVTQKSVSNSGAETATQSHYSANGTLIGKTTQVVSANGLVGTVSVDLDGNGVNDLVTTTTESASGGKTIEGYSYSSTGVGRSHITTTISADGLTQSTIDDLDNNGTTDRSWTSATTLNANGSVTVTNTNYGAGAALQDRVTTTKSADGLTVTSNWDATGSGVSTGSATDVTVINADGSRTRTVSTLNANASLHDRTIVVTSADGRTVTTTEDINGDSTVDHTTVQVQAANGTVTLSSMDGIVQSASGRLYGAVRGRYETVNADGLTTTVQYDANGDSLAEKQSVSAVALNTDGSRVVTLTNSNLSGGAAGAANPVYTVALASKAAITTSADGLSVTSQYDITGAGSYQESKTDITVLNADGSSTETISNLVGATLKTRYSQATSGDGLTTTKQWDTTGSGSYGQASTSVAAVNADGSKTVTTTNTGAAGALVSKTIATTSADGRTTTIQKDLDGNTTYEEKQVATSEVRADGSTVQTVANYINTTTLRDYTKTDISADGRLITVTRDDDQNGQAEQTEATFHRVDGSTVVTTTDYTAAGKVAASLVSTTSQDGLLITSSRDNDGDGIIDRTTTRALVNNADGSSGSTLQIYQTSQKLSNGGVVAIPQALAQSVVTSVSADGKTTTTTVDVDGNGTVDETSTSVTRVDGSVVTTIADNDTARAFNLSAGDARWNSAISSANKTIAVSSVTTVARDGLTRSVLADYDGNGTNEHEETWVTRIDGVQVGTLVDKNASSVVVQSGTETISADGRTVTLATDYTNDGIVDRREVSFIATSGAKTKTTTDYNSSGVATQTIVTTVSANGDKITLTGTSTAETLQGTSADETLIGGAGADKLLGGGGTDTASYAAASAGLTVNLGNTALNTGDAAGDTFESIENVVGTAFNDTITARQNGFVTEYFQISSSIASVNSVNWTATPNYVTSEAYAFWDKGSGAIYQGGPSEYVAIRMKGQFIVSSAGTYTFYDRSDDGSRVYVDGVEIINNDGLHSPTTVSGTVSLTAGTHQIEIKYFEKTGVALLQLEWEGPGVSRRLFEANAAPASNLVAGWRADFFYAPNGAESVNHVNWTGTPILTEIWNTADKNFGTDALFTNGPTDYTGIRLTGQVTVSSAGTYTFYSTSDDGMEIYVDGTRVVNNDGLHGATTLSGTISLATGVHLVEVRYFEASGDAVVKVEWAGPGITRQVMGGTAVSTSAPASPAAVLWGGDGNDTLTGSNAADTLWGQNGNDSLSGGGGDDKLVGGAGTDSLAGGNGVDSASYEDASGAVTVNLGSMGSNTGDAAGDTYSSIEIVIGSQFNDTLTAASTSSATFDGAAGNDTITGGSAIDYLYGGQGDDTLNGNGGIDLLVGGAGNDTFLVGSESDTVVEEGNEGIDLVRSYASFTLTNNVENLLLNGSSNLSGTGNALDNTITGNSGNNTLTGGDGNDALMGGNGADYLDGGAGVDTMIGGAGDDSYLVDDAGDVIVEDDNGGNDLVSATLSYVLGANLNRLVLLGNLGINGTGNTLDNYIYGNSGANVLDGAAGADTLEGGLGDDIYVVDNVGDVVTEGASAGTDRVLASISYALGANVENLTLTGVSAVSGTGNGLANRIRGNAASNTLSGGDGDDELEGGAGVDYLVGGAGTDRASYRNAGAAVTVDLSSIGLNTGDAAGDTYSNIEQIFGSLYADQLYGSSGNDGFIGSGGDDLIVGRAGNDLLDGSSGIDTMIGGTGNDSYFVYDVGDLVVEQINEGASDVVSTTLSYTLVANVEWLALLGSTDINGTGNILNNYMVGNSGANILDGGEGADSLEGKQGNDTYIIDNTGDLVKELYGEGTDTVWSSINYSLGSDVEGLTLVGAAIVGSGNSLANVMYGNAISNQINGGSGNDYLYGNEGDDTLNGGADADTIVGSTGADLLYGGYGSDVFEYLDVSESTATSRDRIYDFVTGDKIRVSSIDADTGVSGDQAFVLDTNASFSAGEIRQSVVGSDLLVEFNNDADSTAEMSVLMVGRTSLLVASDFTL